MNACFQIQKTLKTLNIKRKQLLFLNAMRGTHSTCKTHYGQAGLAWPVTSLSAALQTEHCRAGAQIG